MVATARATCRDCNAPVRWARATATGKWMILDRDPVPGGNVSLLDGAGYRDGADRATVHGNRSTPEGNLQLDLYGGEKPLTFVDHHATCEFADRWRR